jgi:hypothetical protein
MRARRPLWLAALTAHRMIAHNSGVTETELRAIMTEAEVTSLDPLANLICRAADEIEVSATLSDGTQERLYAELGRHQATELVVILSFYGAVARFTNATRAEIEADDPLASATNPSAWLRPASTRSLGFGPRGGQPEPARTIKRSSASSSSRSAALRLARAVQTPSSGAALCLAVTTVATTSRPLQARGCGSFTRSVEPADGAALSRHDAAEPRGGRAGRRRPDGRPRPETPRQS